MNIFRLSLTSSFLFGLTACASTPQLTSSQVGAALKEGKVTVAQISSPIRLSEKTKAQAVGGFALASVGGAALGGNSLEASQVFADTLSRALPESYKIASGAGADLALAKKFSDHFNTSVEANSTQPHNYVLTVKANKWELGYVSFLTSQDYALTYQFHIQVDENVSGKLNQIAMFDCGDATRQSSSQMPYETWVADKYKTLDAEAEKIVMQCYQNGLAKLGLN